MASGYTAAQRDALQAAIANGVLTVEFNGKRVAYRSMDEIHTALSTVLNGLAEDAGTPRTRQIKVYAEKDF